MCNGFRRKRWIIILIIIIVIGVLCLWSLLPPSYSTALKANWGISLPWQARCTEIYEKDSGPSFHGDGIRYHVFSYRYEDYIDLMFAWSTTERSTLYYSTASQAATAWLDEIEVPEEQRPNYPQCAAWYKSQRDHSEILIFWDAELNRLYVVESFF